MTKCMTLGSQVVVTNCGLCSHTVSGRTVYIGLFHFPPKYLKVGIKELAYKAIALRDQAHIVHTQC